MTRCISLFKKEQPPRPPLINIPADIPSALPEHFGFADSLFQTSGLGTWASPTKLEGISNWDRWLDPRRIEGTDDKEYRKFFIDVLKNPTPFIDILKEMNATAHRFSLEWSVIEPEPGRYDPEAIALYRNFIQKLKQEGIEPYVTLHHYVHPEWYEQLSEGFEKTETLDVFVNHALKMMETFPEVTNWMTFNEPNVYGLSSRTMGVYPPGVTGDFAAFGRITRNMMIAHCRIYQAAKEKFGDKVQIGLTHQWLKFESYAGEKLLTRTMAKVTHYAVYNFFKTGKFDFEMPFKANVHLTIPPEEFEKNNQFCDFFGVQFYGFPLLKAGWNGGKEYPGLVKNFCWKKLGFSFGSTCYKGEKVMSFGPRSHPEDLERCLTEAVALKKPIAITEIGADARVQGWGDKEFKIDDATQKLYFEKIFPILDRFKSSLKAFFVWTICRGHLEWNRGDFPRLGVVKVLVDKDRNIVGRELTPAAQYIQKIYQAAKERLTGQQKAA